MTKKILIGIGMLATIGVAYYLLIHKKAKYVDGMVLVAPDSKTYWKIVDGKRVAYVSWQSYLNDGEPLVTTITPEEMKTLPLYPKAYIDETGFKIKA